MSILQDTPAFLVLDHIGGEDLQDISKSYPYYIY